MKRWSRPVVSDQLLFSLSLLKSSCQAGIKCDMFVASIAPCYIFSTLTFDRWTFHNFWKSFVPYRTSTRRNLIVLSRIRAYPTRHTAQGDLPIYSYTQCSNILLLKLFLLWIMFRLVILACSCSSTFPKCLKVICSHSHVRVHAQMCTHKDACTYMRTYVLYVFGVGTLVQRPLKGNEFGGGMRESGDVVNSAPIQSRRKCDLLIKVQSSLIYRVKENFNST